MPTDPATDFALLELEARQTAALNRRAMAWLLGLLALVAGCLVLLALFLRQVEAEDEARARSADAQWLDQTLRFHLRRLEADLALRARQARRPDEMPATAEHAGQLWRTEGAVTFHAWLPVDPREPAQRWPLLQQVRPQHPDNEGALVTLLATTRGLQRPAYAGPLPAADGRPGGALWLAVPQFEQGRFLGDYVAAVDLERALAQLIPSWYLQDHSLTLAADDTRHDPSDASRFVAPIHLPGAQLALVVVPHNPQPAPAPRAFFGVALLCLAGMGVALVLLWRDIQRRQRVEARLQTQMALRTAMERSVTLGLRAWDLDGRLLHVNQAFGRLVGHPPSALVGLQGAMPYWPPGRGEEFAHLRAHMAQPGLQEQGLEAQLCHRDGHLLDVLLHGAPLLRADGTVIGWMGSVLDVTERKRTERLAARQQELLEASGRLIVVGEVASTLAHELNQPLGALSSFANGLLNRLRQGRCTLADVVPVVERMERLADKAGRVIQRVNAFARRQEMSRQPLEITRFVRRVAGHVALPEGVWLTLDLPDQELTLPADALLLEHALHNVVLNAGEWAGRGLAGSAAVAVGLVITDQEAGIVVEDSGPGVAPDQAQQIFDAFASGKPGGMGMGLSICRSIIEAHHGRIEVTRSTRLGGAQFTLWLPLTP
ncbi:sensor histidine kinase [Hydrogenophaga sp. OTU3427]|uniref:sensor histidine kinase n=1 Tax=Hydrogenophaga sp. OTU3427 TaxID=3043856 RepID=UPI00313D4480